MSCPQILPVWFSSAFCTSHYLLISKTRPTNRHNTFVILTMPKPRGKTSKRKSADKSEQQQPTQAAKGKDVDEDSCENKEPPTKKLKVGTKKTADSLASKVKEEQEKKQEEKLTPKKKDDTPKKRSRKGSSSASEVFRDNRLELEQLGYTIKTVSDLPEKDRDMFIAAGEDQNEKLIFDTRCNQVRQPHNYTALKQHATTLQHQNPHTKAKTNRTTAPSTKNERNALFARACLYSGITDGEAAMMASFVRVAYDAEFPAFERVSKKLPVIFQDDLDFLAPQLRASTGFGLDGGLMAKHHVIGMRALPSELWFDNYMIAAGETTDFEVIKIILKHVTEKYPNMRHVVMDSATYNIKVWFCVFSVLLFLFFLFFFLSQGASEAATELLIFLCVGHGIHNIMKNFVKKHYPAVWELVVLLRKAFFNAPTRASRYISAQKAQNLAAPSANGPHEKAYQEFQNILGASSFVLPDTLSTMLAKFFVTYPSITPGTLEETEKLLGDLHQTETAEPKAKSMVDSKGTRWNSLTKLLRHVSERRLAIMAFCAEERQKYGASVCKSIRALVQLLHDTDTVSLWEQVVACSEVMDVPSKLMDGVADPSGTVPPILTLHTSFEKMTTELSSMELTGAKELGTELGNFFRKHKNFPQFSAGSLLVPGLLKLTGQSAVAPLKAGFGPSVFVGGAGAWFTDEVESALLRWLDDPTVITQGYPVRDLWKMLDDSYEVLKKFVFCVLDISPCVTLVDRGFSTSYKLSCNKKRARTTVGNFCMRTQLLINGDVQGKLRVSEDDVAFGGYSTGEETEDDDFNW